MSKHDWPKNDEHLWSEWRGKVGLTGNPKANPPTQYRVCVHPQCNATQERPWK